MSDIASLKTSRASYKGNVTRSFNKTQTLLDALSDQPVLSAGDKISIEQRLSDLTERFKKYDAACHLVRCAPDFANKDEDGEFDTFDAKYDELSAALRLIAETKGSSEASPLSQTVPVPVGESSMPKFSPRKPPVVEQDVDLRTFTQWMAKWDVYASLMELERRPPQKQIQVFWDCLSGGFINIIRRSIGIEAETSLSVKEVIDQIKAHLRSIRNPNLDWRNLLALRQKEGQGYESLCNELLELGDYADTANVTTDRLHTAVLILAIKSEADRQKLIEHDPPLNFAESRKFITTLETARKDSKLIGQTPKVGDKEGAATKSSYRRNKDWPGTKPMPNHKGSQGGGSKGSTGSKGAKCGRCGKPAHPKEQCPAKDKKCDSCGKTGHFANVCRSKKPEDNHGNPSGKSDSASLVAGAAFDTGRSLAVLVKPTGSANARQIEVTAKADTGADVTIMGKTLFNQKFSNVKLEKSAIGIRSVECKKLRIYGQFTANLQVQGHDATCIMHVCDKVKGLYLSLDVCRRLNVVHEDFPNPIAPTVSAANTKPPTERSEIWPDREKWIQELPSGDGVTQKTFDDIKAKLSTEYKSVFDDSEVLRPMKGNTVGEPMHIYLKKDAKPFAVHVARQIPVHIRDRAQKAVQEMIDKAVVTPVGDVPTKWCHPTVFAPKPNNGIRVCTDLTKLNSQVDRTVHHINTPAEAVAEFDAEDEFFAKVDLVKGYWQMPLDEESSWYTVFLTPFGKFRYLRSPMGFVSTGDSFCYRSDTAFSGIPVHEVVDDCALGAKTLSELIRQLCNVLERSRKHDITVNLSKSTFGARKIGFVGYTISKGKIESDSGKLKALSEFPTPANRTDLRSFIGLAQQLGSFTPRLSEAIIPLRDLLRTKNEFQWLEEHTKALDVAKRILISPPVLGMFTKGCETILQTDASRLNGLGFALLQKQDEHWRLIQCGSRFLKDAATRYAMVELESLAILWAVQKCKYYLVGIADFTVVTDHKPLESIYNNFGLTEIDNPRVLNHRVKLTDYRFKVVWKKGKEHLIPDALSRAPVENQCEDDEESVKEMASVASCAVFAAAESVSDLLVDELRKQAADDERYQKLVKNIETDTIALSEDGYVRQFKKMADELSVEDGLILRGSRIVVPPSQIKSILAKLHANHAGEERTKRRAREILFWPGMTNDIKQTVQLCWECQQYRPSQAKEPMHREFIASRPFEIVSCSGVAVDACGRAYLATFSIANCFSTRPASTSCSASTTRDNYGPQFSAEITRQLLSEWNVLWKPSSPHYPQGNGNAEVTVKKIKYLLAKTGGNLSSDKFHEGLLELRNTPLEDGLSPAQRVFGRKLRSVVPTHSSLEGEG